MGKHVMFTDVPPFQLQSREIYHGAFSLPLKQQQPMSLLALLDNTAHMSTSHSQLEISEIPLVLIFQLLQHLSLYSTSFQEIFAIKHEVILATKELVQNLSAFQTSLLELNVQQTLTAE